MIFLLVKLARFVTHKEQETIGRDLAHTLRRLSIHVRIVDDTWGSRNRLLIHLRETTKLSSDIRDIILQNPGVNSLVVFLEEYFEFETVSLSQLLTYLKEYASNKTENNDININYQAFGRVPFHRKAILDRLKRKGIIHNSNARYQLYLEVKQGNQTKDNKIPIIVRLGEKISPISPTKTITTPPTLILYSPYTIQEIADFFRLALTFNTPVLLTDENNLVKKVVEQVESTYFKGISKVTFEIVASLNSLLQENEENSFYGFSLWGSHPISELPEMTASHGENTEKIFFVFGNEENGLPLEVRKLIPMFHIGDKASEPLRASQAAAYALGILNI
ncbi:MAG: TrmH family RNA methyltransferase [Candidatus Hodarchaeales archaeon]|jgi:tRNA(Leu) C34 or U34 (ribose-2'-O)-methylase TrmL